MLSDVRPVERLRELLPGEMVPAARKAMFAFAHGQPDRKVRLPVGYTWRGRKVAPARAVVEEWHLDILAEV